MTTDEARPDCRIGPVRISRLTGAELSARARAAAAREAPGLAVAFCNAHTAEIALKDEGFARALGRFLVVNDGIGVEIGARLLEGRGFPENLNGTDFLPRLFGELSRPTRVYLLGARPGVAEAAAAAFSARFPNYVHAGARDGYFAKEEAGAVAAAVGAAAPDIVLVALGNPAQEAFIAEHFAALRAGAAFGVGALFDFAAGRVARAPGWVRALRAEWLYRLAQEPRRLARRYLVDTLVFLAAVLKLKLTRAGGRNSR